MKLQEPTHALTREVWCCCGNTGHSNRVYQGTWVECTFCCAWQHFSCYKTHTEEEESDDTDSLPRLEPVVCDSGEEDSDEEKSSVESEQELDFDEMTQAEKRALSRQHKQRLTQVLALKVSQNELLVPKGLAEPSSGDEFLCWACRPLEGLQSAEDNSQEQDEAFEALSIRVELMNSMIGAASGGYSRRSFERNEPMLCITPAHVTRFAKTLIDRRYDCMVCELGAGNGSISSVLPPDSLCVEICEKYIIDGKEKVSHVKWLHHDALDPEFYSSRFGMYDLVVSNPPFELALQFIFVALAIIRNYRWSSRPDSNIEPGTKRAGRLLFLLPSDYFEASNLRARVFKLLDFHIETEYRLGHLSYYANAPNAQKQTCDSLFVLRPGGRGMIKYEHKVVNARLAGFLG